MNGLDVLLELIGLFIGSVVVVGLWVLTRKDE